MEKLSGYFTAGAAWVVAHPKTTMVLGFVAIVVTAFVF